MLRIGRIDYLNVWPLFEGIQHRLEPGILNRTRMTVGHPADLNVALAEGKLDVAPSSSFEYLLRANNYALLPDLTISSDGPVRSVLLACPFPFSEMPKHAASGLRVGLSTASTSSVALLRILWRFHWGWPEPEWVTQDPGQGPEIGIPFLEIGDHALRLHCNPPPGWHLADLGQEWKSFTRLPFVFGVWMVRRDLSPEAAGLLVPFAEALYTGAREFQRDPCTLAARAQRPDWLTLKHLQDYWQCIRYAFGPREQAGLVLFGDYVRKLGMISAVPGLTWSRPTAYDDAMVA
ncbi:menaquinone biosynthesis protein [Desulfonatronum thioautotrophicum]|uniref:menaquinone biosynthesis protein n=1 Tax=Desulfonatronum thioautotrophicum TaxID=617001 RepID=UPI0005EBBBC0|nr:menaquinone biosynthesis protein [Desulfonatronum thioautotrophicum]